jgi:5-methylthioadenosine/S-adenosylhomocysteine deaminase
MTATVIKNADWVIAWDEGVSRQVYRRGVDIAFTDDRIDFVGRDYTGPVDRVIDGRDRLVLPGLIDIHSHPDTSRSTAACARSMACATCI